MLAIHVLGGFKFGVGGFMRIPGSLAGVWERFRGGFTRVLMVFRRFWEVFEGSGRVWSGFMRF